MAEILFLAHRIPYPPDKGDKIRAWHVMSHIMARHQVHLGCFIDDPADKAHRAFLASRCQSTCFIEQRQFSARLKSLPAFLTGEPLSLRYYGSRAMRRWVAETMASRPIATIMASCSTMAPYVLPYTGTAIRTLIDFIDIDSDKWRQYAARAGWPMSVVYAREARRLLRFEQQVAKAVDHSIFVSGAEAAMFRALAPDCADKVHGLENGVDTDYFDADMGGRTIVPADGPLVVFTGAMDYWANIDAVRWFAAEIWPLVRVQCPTAQFYIIGGKPSPEVRALADQPGIVVTGRVDDVRPYLRVARLAVAPMRIARGVQNKVLEAMAMALPVITTPQGHEGIDAVAGVELLVENEPAAYAAAVAGLLAAPHRAAQMGQAARRCVIRRYGWAAALAPLDEWLEPE